MYRPIANSLVAIAALLGGAGHAYAACQTTLPNRVAIISGTAVTIASYDPFSASDRTQSFAVTVNNPHPTNACSFALSFTRTTLASGFAAMTSGAASLQYTIEVPGGNTLLQATGFVANSSPPATYRVAGTVLPSSQTSIPVQVRIPKGQVAAAGSYVDISVTVGIYELSGANPIRIVQETAFTVAGSVISACQLPSPNLSNLNFDAAINNGRANPGVVRLSSFMGVKCTAPAKVKLTADAMRPSSPPAAIANFDNFINFRASASLSGDMGAASATLTTNQTAGQTSAMSPAAATLPSSGTNFDVSVNLLDGGRPIAAGSYSSVLTITVDPNP